LKASWKNFEGKKKERRKEGKWIIINNYKTFKLRIITENIHRKKFLL